MLIEFNFMFVWMFHSLIVFTKIPIYMEDSNKNTDCY